MNKIILLFIGIWLFSGYLNAQQNEVFFEQITNESGRSLGFITGIFQDETGFMWFSTRKGLYRYNGYSYKLFKNNNTDSTSLPFNDIAFLYGDKKNKLWLRHYDELAIFSDEKRFFGYDSVLKQHFDIEVKVVHDIYNNYWIGPTTNGLIQYNPQKNINKNYNCPPSSYTLNAWLFIDSVLSVNNKIAAIKNPCNNTDTTISFIIDKKGFYLIASSGEIDNFGLYDFGSLTKDNKIIWEINLENSKWAGGDIKNRFEASIIELDKGVYNLKFKSDLSHCCSKWDSATPDKLKNCGVFLVAVENNTANQLKAAISEKDNTNTRIESNNIKDLVIDNTGGFWFLSDKGLSRFNYAKKHFDHINIDFEKLLGVDMSKEFFCIFQDSKNVFWIGTTNGLISFDYTRGRNTVFKNGQNKTVLTSNSIYTIYEDNSGLIWIGTDNGLNIWDRERMTMEQITANNRNRLYDNRITKIYEDKSGNIWVATFEGLNRLIKNPFKYKPLNIDADNVYPVQYDQSANIWYAHQNKIYKYSRSLDITETYTLPDKLFNLDKVTNEHDYIINDMVITSDKNIWVATDNNISRFNIYTQNIDFTIPVSAIIVGNDSIKNHVKKLMPAQAGKLYAFSPDRLTILNFNDLVVQSNYPFNIVYDFIEDVDPGFFKSACLDNKNQLWIRTGNGISVFNPQIATLKNVLEFDNTIKLGPASGGIISNDNDGNIWVSALPYLFKINGADHKIDSWQCQFENDWGTSNVKIGKKNIWLYGSNGLFGFDQNTGKFTLTTVEDGLIDNNINGIEEDNYNNLWLSSLKGLNKFDTQDKVCYNYFTSADNVTHRFLGNPTNFRPTNGEMILFTTKGFVSFFPDSINLKQPRVVIDRFTIRGKDYQLDSLIYKTNEIVLNHKLNFIAFEFAVLDYTSPALNKYAYMLEGLDDTWVYTDSDNRKASYSGLSPGKYIFKVKGSNNDKVWNEQGVAINITITPPWYKTTVAYILYVVLTALLIWLFIKRRERQLIEEKRILEEKVRQRTAKIEAQKEELATQNEKIAEQHKNITDSIYYAQRIQRAILPPIEQIAEVVDDYFVLYRPRDIVSGDYYWATRINHLTIIVAADCTGHGVPGAFMSMLGIAFLNEIVNKEAIVKPDMILNRLREQVIKQLHQTGKEGESKDGMDVSLYVIDHNIMKLQFAGAYNPLYIIRNNDVITLKADRMPIGYYIKKDEPFTMQEIELKKGDCLYNSSDGYPDQFGGEDGRKFMSKNFRELLLEVHQKPMSEQKEILNQRIDKWRGNIEQIDDIIVIGVRV